MPEIRIEKGDKPVVTVSKPEPDHDYSVRKIPGRGVEVRKVEGRRRTFSGQVSAITDRIIGFTSDRLGEFAFLVGKRALDITIYAQGPQPPVIDEADWDKGEPNPGNAAWPEWWEGLDCEGKRRALWNRSIRMGEYVQDYERLCE